MQSTLGDSYKRPLHENIKRGSDVIVGSGPSNHYSTPAVPKLCVLLLKSNNISGFYLASVQVFNDSIIICLPLPTSVLRDVAHGACQWGESWTSIQKQSYIKYFRKVFNYFGQVAQNKILLAKVVEIQNTIKTHCESINQSINQSINKSIFV